MKRFNVFILLLAAVILLCACQKETTKDPDDSSSKPSDTVASDTASDSVSDEQPTESEVSLIENGKSEYKIIRADDINSSESWLLSNFYKELCKKYDCDIDYETDLIAHGKKPDPNAKEILIGHTNRDESKALKEKLEAAGGNRFAISFNGTKVALIGTSTYQTYLGLDYLFSNYTVSQNAESSALIMKSGLEYISESSEKDSFTIDELIKSGKGVAFAASEKVLKVSAKNGHTGLQGGCTDGKYAYIALINSSSEPNTGMIFKYDLETLELVKESGVLPTGHSNDITYDSKNHRLIVATLLDGWTQLAVINPDTLEFVENIKASTRIRGFEYLPEIDGYAVAQPGPNVAITDANFNVISESIPFEDKLGTTQGFYSDGTYTYDPRYFKTENYKGYHTVVIGDANGNHIQTAKVYGLDYIEPEHMYICNGKYYIGCNMNNSLYTVEIMPKIWW